MNNKNTRILMELLPCYEGYAGIPQETRILFSSFLDMPTLEVYGLMNSHKRLTRGISEDKKYSKENQYKKINKLSRFIVSHYHEQPEKHTSFFYKKLNLKILKLLNSTAINHFESENFSDFIWETFFSKTLPISDFNKVTKANFCTVTMSRNEMYHLEHKFIFPKLNSKSYDIFLSQTPFPGRFPEETQLVVRYHDAVPLFAPHLISDIKKHQKKHFRPLKANAKTGVFACSSHATRNDLLAVFPTLEKRAVVIHDVISQNYYEEYAPPERLSEIIISRLNSTTQPKYEANGIYEQNLLPKKLRYLLMVSTIEPRKNHIRLIRAWELLRAAHDPDLKLIIVGELGWSYDTILETMSLWQKRFKLFHLTSVLANELRLLYNGAACVVCPSISEGFDLSGIEAMLCGNKVAASDIPTHREIYGQGAVYFNTYSVNEQAEAIAAVVYPKNPEIPGELRKKGLQQTQRYLWETIGPQWQNLFDRIKAGDYKR